MEENSQKMIFLSDNLYYTYFNMNNVCLDIKKLVDDYDESILKQYFEHGFIDTTGDITIL